MLKFWICDNCALLNKYEESECRSCTCKYAMSRVEFESMEKMKKWLKLMKEKMDAKVWWSP